MFRHPSCARLLLALALGLPARAARAQDQISGFVGFDWGTTRDAILARFGKPREDMQQDSLERISYVQGPDSGYLFGLVRGRGLVAGIRILPLPAGNRCGAAVQAAKDHLARQFGRLTPVETMTRDSSAGSCDGYKEWNVLWREASGNRVLLSVDNARHRLYVNYSSRLSPY